MPYLTLLLLLYGLIILSAALIRRSIKILRFLSPTFDRWCGQNFPKVNQFTLRFIGILLVLILIPFFLIGMWLWKFISQYIYQRDRKRVEDLETTPEQLEKLAASLDRTTRQRVAQNANSSPDVLLKLGEQFPQELLNNPVFDLLLLENPNLLEEMPEATFISLLRQPDLPESLLEQAAKSRRLDLDGAIAIVQHPKASIKMVDAIKPYYYHELVAETVIQRPDLSLTILENLAEAGNNKVLLRIAQRSDLTLIISEKLIKRRNLTVQLYFAQKSNLPISILELLVQYGYTAVRRKLLQHESFLIWALDNSDIEWAARSQVELLQQNSLSEQQLKQLAVKGTKRVQVLLAQKIDLSEAVLDRLAEYGRPAAKAQLVKRADVPERILLKALSHLAYHPHPSMRQVAAQHLKLPDPLLKKLVQDSDLGVQESAIATLRLQSFR